MAPIPLPRSLISTLIRHRSDADIGDALHERSALPSSALHDSLSSIVRRQTQIISIPATYGGLNSGQSPGTVAGIVLGTVGGFIIVLYLLYTVFGLGNNGREVEEEVVVRSSRSPSRRRRNPEVVEVVRSRTPPRSRHRHDTVVVEESVTTQTEDDVVEVIEEASSPEPPRRTRSKRTSGSYRPVDPYEYGGGAAPPRHVRR